MVHFIPTMEKTSAEGCYDLANRLSHYLYFFSFSFLLFWTGKIKVTHMEAQDFSVRLGSDICISRVENPTGTLSSSPCQTLIKE